MLDYYCAGLVHPVQKVQEQNPVLFTGEQACENAQSLLVQCDPYM